MHELMCQMSLNLQVCTIKLKKCLSYIACAKMSRWKLTEPIKSKSIHNFITLVFQKTSFIELLPASLLILLSLKVYNDLLISKLWSHSPLWLMPSRSNWFKFQHVVLNLACLGHENCLLNIGQLPASFSLPSFVGNFIFSLFDFYRKTFVLTEDRTRGSSKSAFA